MNSRRFAKNSKKERRTATPGPRPTDLPPRLKPGFRYTEGGLPNIYSGILRNDLDTVNAYLLRAKQVAEKLDSGDGGKEDDSVAASTAGVKQRLGVYPDGTLLHLAAQHSSVEMVALLLKYGEDIHAADDLGNTPLHRAVKKGKINVVKTLLKHQPTEVGRLLDARNIDDLTPVQIAIQFGYEKIRSLFINHLKLSGKSLSSHDRTHAAKLAQLEEGMHHIRKAQKEELRKLREAEELKDALKIAAAKEARMRSVSKDHKK